MSASPPLLAIVVDTEEEFDWTKPFARENRSTSSIPAQALAHEIYDPLGMVPTYVIDHPVATDERAVDFLAGLQRSGRAEIGTHLHPWVSPPHEEEVTRRNSYHCNLPPGLERAKIIALTDEIARRFGRRPTVFKAGRYGFGPNTREVLIELGYTIDCSYVPHVSFARDGGPDYQNTPDQPFWLDREGGLLEVPLTSGFFGAVAAAGPMLQGLLNSPRAERLRIPGMLARSGLVSRSRLSPEGVDAAEQCRLLKAMVGSGRRFFTLTYHSPSLAPGHTPYVRSEADLADFLKRIETVLLFFRDVLGGRFTTLSRYRAELLGESTDARAA
ncbi:polysaccharide deacetylase family protein [Sphingomonas parva]|uniref:polysaccharide deacetylase family protein n=1 Tax=Sphingomonas parva TaxID=2555898 RepID=UPI0014305AD8|nr:polysaccharide deacetylase family protein [Sphingomonas parva]